MIKLTIAILLFLSSLLVLFRAPHNVLWLCAVAVTNYPLVFILLSGISALAGRAGRYPWPVMILSIVSLIIFSMPIFNALAFSPSMLKKIFPSAVEKNAEPPFNFFRMFRRSTNDSPVTVVYKKVGSQQLTFDFFSAGNKNAPLVVVIHGGSWSGGDSKQLPELNTYLSHRGYHVASINYRLAPAYKSPAPIEDTRDALNFLIGHASQFKIDTSSIILLGRSAGAQIALAAAYSLKIPSIKAVISYYGPADMIWGGQVKVSRMVLNTDKIYRDYFGGLYSEVPVKFKEASALEYISPRSVPTLIIHGKADPLVSFTHGIHLRDKLNDAGVANYFLELAFATHGCDFNLNGPDGQLCTYATETFLKSIVTRSWKK